LKKLGDRLPDVGESATATEIHWAYSGTQHEQWNYFARVIGRSSRWVVPMIGGKDNEVLVSNRLE